MNDILTKVYKYACQAHGDQKRKYSGDPYITHCYRVMKTCEKYTDDVAVLSAALLHDVLEDTEVDEKRLSKYLHSVMGISDAKKTLQLVVDLTDIYIKKDYPNLNRKERKKLEADRLHGIHPDAQTVKYADIIDNTVDITANDKGFANKYLYEVENILSGMDQGDNKLYRQALETVEQCMNRV